MSAPDLEIDGLRRRRGPGFCLELDGLGFGIRERLVVLGPTGAGKSTLLRLLLGLEVPDQGRLRWQGKEIRPHRELEARRLFTWASQAPVLLDGSPLENLAFARRARGLRVDEVRARELLEGLGIGGLAHRSPTGLSGGERRLVAIARALHLESPVLLLDEPTSDLDPARTALVEARLEEERRRREVLQIWVTHNLGQARRLADRVLLLLGGRVIEYADRDSFFDRPRDPRSADFLSGRMIW